MLFRSPVLDAVAAQIDSVAASAVDVVVLAASFPTGGRPTPECDAMVDLPSVNRCTTLTLPDPNAASLDTITTHIKQAEVVYFAGGNQCDYVKWGGSPLHRAVTDAVARGGGMGGGSAGLAIQGSVVYDGCTGSVRSSEAMADPYDPAIHFTRDMFAWPVLDALVTDSHFQERDRMGRLAAFLAREHAERSLDVMDGLGVNEGAAMVVGPTGRARVIGNGAFFLRVDHPPERVAVGQPLTASNIAIVRLSDGETYDLTARPMDAAARHDIENGTWTTDPY